VFRNRPFSGTVLLAPGVAMRRLSIALALAHGIDNKLNQGEEHD